MIISSDPVKSMKRPFDKGGLEGIKISLKESLSWQTLSAKSRLPFNLS